MKNYIIIPISDFISHTILKTIRGTFVREPMDRIEITEEELWTLLKKYKKQGHISTDEYLTLGAFMKFLLVSLHLRK